MAAADRAVADPSFGSDGAVPFPGVAANTVLEPTLGAPMLGPVPAPPLTVLPSLAARRRTRPAFGEVDDFSYGDENPTYFPLSVEFSVAPGVAPAAPEPPGPLCANPLDDDGDGFINDGCPPVLGPEPPALCANAIDDDGDLVINDGCPARGAPAPATGHPLAPMPPLAPAFDVRTEAGILLTAAGGRPSGELGHLRDLPGAGADPAAVHRVRKPADPGRRRGAEARRSGRRGWGWGCRSRRATSMGTSGRTSRR